MPASKRVRTWRSSPLFRGAELSALVRLAVTPLDPDKELARVLRAPFDAGAVVSFTGLVRPTSKTGAALEELHLDHYPGMTERSMQLIADDALAAFPVDSVDIVHRCGTIRPGEAIVFVAAAAQHRRAAFEAADYMMDRLKSQAMFWKRETGADGSAWVEPTDGDRADLARWSR